MVLICKNLSRCRAVLFSIDRIVTIMKISLISLCAVFCVYCMIITHISLHPNLHDSLADVNCKIIAKTHQNSNTFYREYRYTVSYLYKDMLIKGQVVSDNVYNVGQIFKCNKLHEFNVTQLYRQRIFLNIAYLVIAELFVMYTIVSVLVRYIKKVKK